MKAETEKYLERCGDVMEEFDTNAKEILKGAPAAQVEAVVHAFMMGLAQGVGEALLAYEPDIEAARDLSEALARRYGATDEQVKKAREGEPFEE